METDWTCLIYMAADNDLRGDVKGDLAEMMKASSDDVGVAVQLDELGKKTVRLALHGDEFVTRQTLDNVNSGDPAVVTDFFQWGEEELAAAKYMVVLWGHGTGFLDFAGMPRQTKPVTALSLVARKRRITACAANIDFTSQDFLDNSETRQALMNALPGGEKFSILGCDACFMAGLEVAHELRECASIFVASEEIEENDGWPYAEMLSSLADDATPEDAARTLVKAYGEANAADRRATLSAVRLDRLDEVAASLDCLGAALSRVLPNRVRAIATARTHSRKFTFVDYIDLGSFAGKIGIELADDPEVVHAVKEVMHSIGCAVLATSRPPEESDIYGIGIYLPDKPVAAQFHTVSLAEAAGQWASFVVAYGEARQHPLPDDRHGDRGEIPGGPIANVV